MTTYIVSVRFVYERSHGFATQTELGKLPTDDVRVVAPLDRGT